MLYVEITHQNGTVESFAARLYAPHYEDRGTWDPFYGRYHESLDRMSWVLQLWLPDTVGSFDVPCPNGNLMFNEASFAGL